MKKNLLSLTLMLGLCAASASAQETFKQDVFTYTTTGENTVELTKADSKDAANEKILIYTVPATVTEGEKTYNVTSIGENAFKWSYATTITLPDGIEKFGNSAFSSSEALVNINMPANLKTIDKYAFSSTGIKSIEIPASVKEIGYSAFFTCKSLTSITLHEGLEKIGGSAFYKCALKNVVLPESVTDIEAKAFYNCADLESITLPSSLTILNTGTFLDCAKLKSIEIPAGVKEIGEECFLRCSALTEIKISATVEKIGTGVFAKTSITSFNVDPANKYFHVVDGVLYDINNHLLYAVPMKGKTEVKVDSKCIGINGGAFWGSEVAKVTLPEGLLAIDAYAFCQSALAEINFPKTITYIGEQGFAATHLKEVTLPENMPYVYDGAFAGIEELTNLTIPSGVKIIGNHAFHNCKNLSSVTSLGATAPEIDDVYEDYDSPFWGISESTPLYIPKGSTASYKQAGWNSYFNLTETDKGVLTPVSMTPDNGTKLSKYADMKVDIVFSEDITIVNDTPDVFMREGSEMSGATIDAENSWRANNGDNNQTLRIWASDLDGFPQTFTPKAETKYYIIIPAGVVKNAAGDMNEKIVVEWVGPDAPKVLKVVSTSPVNGEDMTAGLKDMTFDITFESDITILDYGPDVTLTEINGDTQKKITPDYSWKAVKNGDNTLRIWGSDYDSHPMTYQVKENCTYRLVIPAGIVQNADKAKNEEIIIEWNGPVANSIDGINADNSEPKAYYNINGQHLSSKQKGLNIVRMANGKTVKVMVK